MVSLRLHQRLAGVIPSSVPGSGAGTRSSARRYPLLRHRRRRLVPSLSASPTPLSGIDQPETSPAYDSLASSSSPASTPTSSPSPGPPKGDIKPTGYSVADWAAAFESQLQEFDYDIEVKGAKEINDDDNSVTFVEGEIPRGLRGGTLFRNGPSRFQRREERYAHMLDGDGYVLRFEFSEDGSKVSFLSRFVKTRELVAEDYADRILFRSTFGTQRGGGNPLLNAFDFRLKNPANTNVVPWGGRLLALWEAGPPYELDPRTLETKKPATLGGLVAPGSAPTTTGISRKLDEALGFGSALTAHPHVVPAPPGEAGVWYGSKEEGGGEGEKALSPCSSSNSSSTLSKPTYPSPTSRLATWAWQSQMTHNGPVLSIEVAEFDARFRRVAKAHLSLEGASFNPHDFAVSPRYYTFFQNDTTFSMAPYVFGLKGPAQCVKIGLGELTAHVAPRGQSHPQHSPRSISIRADEGGFLIHHAACFEDASTGEIVVWSSGWAPEELERLADAAASSRASTATGGDGGDEGGGGEGKRDDDGDGDDDPTLSLGRKLSRLARRLSSSSSGNRNRSTSDDSMLGSWKVVLNGDFDGIPHSTLQEHRIDLVKKKITRKTLFDDQAMEHPKINPLFATREPRYVYFTAARSLVPGKAAPPQAIVKLDVKTGDVETWAPGRRCFCEEIVFVPDTSTDEEDAGFLLSMVFDASVNKSSLVVLDAKSLEEGPVARVWLRHHVPHGLHGEWLSPGAPGF